MGLHQHNFACTAALRVNNVAVDCIVDRGSEGSDPLGIKPGTDSPCVTYVDHTIEKVKVETISLKIVVYCTVVSSQIVVIVKYS